MTFVPRSFGVKDCDFRHPWPKYGEFDYIVRAVTGDLNYIHDCTAYLQVNILADNINVLQNVNIGQNLKVDGNADIAGVCKAGSFQGPINVQSWKGFDIKHPNKENHRLRHICLEGPEAGVYFRGRLKNSNVIKIPEYWQGLVDLESITVSLTPIGYSQELIVEKIEWGKNIIVKSGNGSNIDCYYHVHGSRTDGEELIVEYEGSSPKDYPGNSSQYSISGYDYGAKGVDRAD